ncbi:MAG: YHS domain-containing protein [Lacibacter sp.]
MVRLVVIAAAFLLASCSGNESNHSHEPAAAAASKKEQFKDVVFANEKDYICGMPVSAGVADTAHYNGKVYGFCATECKEEFLKNPEQYIAGSNK